MESFWSIPDKDENIDQDELGIKQKDSLQLSLQALEHMLVEEDNSAKKTEKEGRVGGK